jgi:DNA (cytosine-5)-methyltransferase 1
VGTRLGWEDSLFPRGSHGPSRKPSEHSSPYVHRWSPGREQTLHPLTTVWDAIGDLPPSPSKGCDLPYRRKARTAYQRTARKRSVTIQNHVPHNLGQTMLKRVRSIPEGGDWRDIPRRLLPDGMKRALRSDHTKRYGRLSRHGQCCTILTKCDPHWGGYIHPIADRTITVREAARLQSFPDRFRFCTLISKQYEQIGNAVPPLMARRLAQAVCRHIRKAERELPWAHRDKAIGGSYG